MKLRFTAIKLLLVLAFVYAANEASGNSAVSVPFDLALDPEFQPQLGTYHYNVQWLDSEIAKVKFTVAREGDFYKIKVKAKTLNMFDVVYKLRYRGEGRISAEDLAPVRSYTKEVTSSYRKETTVKFRDDGSIESVQVKTKGGKKPRTKTREIENSGNILDPFSAIFLARHLEWKTGQAESFEVFKERQRYLVKLNCQGMVKIKVSGKERSAWVITSNITNIDKPKKKPGMGETVIFISADEAKEVLFIKSETKFGKITALLDKLEPAKAD